MFLTISRTILILSLVLFLTACGSVQIGRDFDMHTFETKIERGVTNQTQIRGWLGAPTGTGMTMDSNGEQLDEWSYYFASGKLSDLSGAKVKMLQIRFDKQGIARSYNWSTSDH